MYQVKLIYNHSISQVQLQQQLLIGQKIQLLPWRWIESVARKYRLVGVQAARLRELDALAGDVRDEFDIDERIVGLDRPTVEEVLHRPAIALSFSTRKLEYAKFVIYI